MLYGFDVIVYLSATHFTDAFHLLGCRDMGDKGHNAEQEHRDAELKVANADKPKCPRCAKDKRHKADIFQKYIVS